MATPFAFASVGLAEQHELVFAVSALLDVDPVLDVGVWRTELDGAGAQQELMVVSLEAEGCVTAGLLAGTASAFTCCEKNFKSVAGRGTCIKGCEDIS